MKRTIALLTVAVVIFTSAPAFAAKGGGKSPSVSGSIELMEPAPSGLQLFLFSEPEVYSPSYGDDVMFDVVVEGDVSRKARVYIRVWCMNGNDEMVYLAVGATDGSFTLTDPASDAVEWHGEAASCTAGLVHDEVKGKNRVISYLDFDHFDVAAA